jgi:hypothetical protein
MNLCPDCGHVHPPVTAPEAEVIGAEAAVADTAKIADTEVKIEQIRADKEVEIARIQAGMIDADRDEQLARAEGKAEALEEVIAPDPEPDPAPIVIDAPEAVAEDDAPDDAPPAADATEGSAPPAPAASKKLGLGAW